MKSKEQGNESLQRAKVKTIKQQEVKQIEDGVFSEIANPGN